MPVDSIGNQTIVVGIDGSSAGDAALAWAIDEASRRGLGLHVVSAGMVQAHRGESVYDDSFVDTAFAREALREADSFLAEAVRTAGRVAPGLVVTIGSGLDGAAGVLVDLSTRAHSVVVGHSAHGRVLGALLGSVASQVVTHAHCPVVVVHEAGEGATAPRGVVVGVDGSSGSELALAYAFEQASLRGVDLHVVHVWWTRATAARTPDALADKIAEEQLTLAESMAGWSERYPDVEVRVTMPVGPTVLAITGAARDAELLVVGRRGHGGFRSLLLGSVSQGVISHAPCTVVVVRAPKARPEPSVTFGTTDQRALAGP